MESFIDSDRCVETHDNDLDSEIEDIETSFGVVPSWVVSRSWDICYSCAEGSAKGEDEGREEKDSDLGSEAAFTEFIDVLDLVGKEDSEKDDGNRQEGRNSEVRRAHKLDVAIDASSIVGEREEGLHSTSNECYQ